MLKVISSRDNKIIKTARLLSKKKGREKNGLYIAEGVRITRDAIEYIPEQTEYVIASESYCEKDGAFIDKLDKSGKIVYITDDKIFNEICDTETPQGIAAVIKIPNSSELDVANTNYVLILDGISDPGNMGTIIRTAEASGIGLICLTDGCADIYSPKVVRSSMSSVFRMRFARIKTTDVSELKKSGFTVVATALDNSVSIDDADVTGKRAIVIGSEARGVSDEIISMSDISVRIDMCGHIESLNAAVAAGIAMYVLRP